ncbi:MAG TPA: nucleoside triphosphate pyrophosphohydrolase [Longimicrobium sp.]|nr:nucleoside triphosphate pyrophosphohydrolase [Longimicrobium sp.]
MNPSQAENPPPGPHSGGTLDRALALAAFLRARCPWDAAQTPLSLQPYLLEEAHEAARAIAAGDTGAIRDELGDLLLNVAFQVVMAEEAGAFGRNDVVRAAEQKMRRRHPHLYGGQHEPWAAIKARERAGRGLPDSILDAVPEGLDPLQRAYRVQARVAEFGFDWSDWRGAWDKVREEVDEVGVELLAGETEKLEEELGDLLFAVVNLVRLAGAHPTSALSRANAKFERRFGGVEALAAERGIEFGSATLEELDVLWDEVKRRERAGHDGAGGMDAE